MKKIIFIILLSVFCMTANAQKKKKSASKTSKTNVLAKADNVTLELKKNNFNLYITNGKIRDSILVKAVSASTPTDCKLSSFTSKGVKLYLLTYTEKSLVQSTNKTEDITALNSEIYELETKSKVFGNIQKSTKITEKVFLDRLKNASETQEKMRNEGYLFQLLPDGDVSLSSKSASNKMTYDVVSKQFVDNKKKK